MVNKREIIDNSIIRELKEKYPNNLEDTNEISYKVKLEYITFEIDFITDPLITYLIDMYGVNTIGLIHFLRSKMCFNGWCVRVDKFYLNQLLKQCANTLNTNIDDLKIIYDELIENEYFYIVSDETVVKGSYLTCIQQIFNFEIASSKRKSDRERKAKQREKEKQQANNNNTSKETNIEEEQNKGEEVSLFDEIIYNNPEVSYENFENLSFDEIAQIGNEDSENYF